MAENRLLDTNVLVYAYDVSEAKRRAIAKGLVDNVWDAGGGVLTLQTLSEFFFAVTRKVQKPVPHRGREDNRFRYTAFFKMDGHRSKRRDNHESDGDRRKCPCAVSGRSYCRVHARTWHRDYRHGKRERL